MTKLLSVNVNGMQQLSDSSYFEQIVTMVTGKWNTVLVNDNSTYLTSSNYNCTIQWKYKVIASKFIT